MKITLLGTGTSQGVPVIGCSCPVCQSQDPRDSRLRSSVHIQDEETSIVVDIGPDFRQQMLTHNIDRLDAILLTHEHNDHIIGLDEVRPFNFRQRKPMSIYGGSRVFEKIRERFGYIFAEERYPGTPELEIVNISKDSLFQVNSIPIQVVEVLHGQLPIFGFRIGKFCYLTDVKYIPEKELEKLQNLDILVLNALHHRPHHSHLNVAEAVELVDRIKPNRTYLTHVSHYMGLYCEVNGQLSEDLQLAYDGMVMEL